MALSHTTLAAALGLLLGVTLGAQQPEPSTLGFEVRGSLPESGLASATGSNAPGLGFSLVMEDDLVEHFEDWRARYALGADFWVLTKKNAAGTTGSVRVAHLSGELVRMLRPGGDPVALGPYVVAGLGIYEWSYTKDDPVLGPVATRVGHLAGTFGFGWRKTKSLDLEAKVMGGELDPNTTALALMLSATFRF